MHLAQIAALLQPFAAGANDHRQTTNDALYRDISTYLDLLLRWNARINLTAIRNPEEILTRHFGESLFAARHIFPFSASSVSSVPSVVKDFHLADLGSGPGFPGLPIKLYAPHISLTLIESNHKKAAFLREVVRALSLSNVEVTTTRAEHLSHDPAGHNPVGHNPDDRNPPKHDPPKHDHFDPDPADPKADPEARFDVVTLRAVERFTATLPIAARLLKPQGRLALLIGSSQLDQARSTLPRLRWQDPLPIPQSNHRILLLTRTP